MFCRIVEHDDVVPGARIPTLGSIYGFAYVPELQLGHFIYEAKGL